MVRSEDIMIVDSRMTVHEIYVSLKMLYMISSMMHWYDLARYYDDLIQALITSVD